MIGQTLGHYRIIEKIGAGGMGEVYRAHDDRLDRDVALKALPAGLFADEVARKRFRKEAQTLSKLNHPNIATVHEFDRQGGVDFLVMEYITGITLSDKLSLGALPEKEVTRVGQQLAEGLAAAHAEGVVHRDLKPGNLRLTADGRLKILDFGLAKFLGPVSATATTETLSETQAGLGTLPYMSPEQVRGETADGRSDIWAVGAVLHEMVTGRRAFPGKLALPLAESILHQPPVALRQVKGKVSPDLERIILKCLEKEPENRYQSAKELAVDLRRLALPEPARVAAKPRRDLLRPGRAVAAMALIAILSVAYFAWRSYWPRPLAPARKIMLAVLPFENLGGDPEKDYFSDGLTEEMIAQLGGMQPRRLGVIARTSAMRYKHTDKGIDQIGRELGVEFILEGSVRHMGDRVRITAQLIQVKDQTHLWAESYERDLAGVLALQTEAAGRIGRSLALELLPERQVDRARARAATTNSAAYETYLKGRYHWHKGSAEERRKAREYFEQAVQIDPNYAPAYADLAGYYWATTDLPRKMAMPKAKEYALKALELDDTLTQAHTALAGIRFYGEWDWSGAESEFKRALALNPSDAEAHRIYSFYLLTLGRFEEALLEVRRSEELDPLSLLASVNAGWAFYFARQYDRAIEQCQKALELDADSDGAHACLGQSYRAQGMHKLAVAESERAVVLSSRHPARLVGLARAYSVSSRKADAKKVLAELGERAKHSYVPPYLFAMTHAALGEVDQALAALEQGYAERDIYMTWLKVDDAFDALRGEPGFRNLLRRMGFPP